MQVEKFLNRFPDLLGSSEGESEFAAIRVLTAGMSTAKTGKILNQASSMLDKGEIYVEIGTFTGFSLICAAYQIPDRNFIGIDNFSFNGLTTHEDTKEIVRKRLATNIAYFPVGSKRIIEGDFRNVSLPPDQKIGVFYIDGYHTRQEVIDNFKWGHEKLASKALIFVDDISIGGVGEGVADWVRENKEYKEVFRMYAYSFNNTFHNGLSILIHAN